MATLGPHKGLCTWLGVVVICLTADRCLAASYADYQALVSALFSNYSKELRPMASSAADPLSVRVTMSLASIQDLDEIGQQLTFSALLHISWNDSHFVWNPKDHNGVFEFSYPLQDVWIPDVTVVNAVQGITVLSFGRDYVHVLHSGRVIWNVGGLFKTACDIDITYYPFDSQECNVNLATLVSKRDQIILEGALPEDSLRERYQESGSWILQSVTVSSGEDGVVFTLRLERRRLYYVVTIVIPVLFLSLTATLVFALPADSGEKMGTSITVLLAFAVYLTIVSDQMPKTSMQAATVKVSILAVYLTMLLGQTSLGVLITVWILNLHFRDDQHPPGMRMRKAVLLLERLMCKRPDYAQVVPDPDKEITATDQDAEKTTIKSRDKELSSLSHSECPEMTWRHVSAILDRALFYSFTILLFFLSVVFLKILALG